MNKLIPLVCCIVFTANLKLKAQAPPIYISYCAPYAIQTGGKIGTSFDLKQWESKTKKDISKTHRLQFSPQLAYFAFPTVQQNLLVNSELIYRYNKSDKRFYPKAGIALGYLWANQKKEGTVNLGTGEISYESENLHYFVPTLNLGFGGDPKKHIGYFFNAFYGRKFSAQAENDAFFGLEFGISIHLK